MLKSLQSFENTAVATSAASGRDSLIHCIGKNKKAESVERRKETRETEAF
jgi:hypothetical protein